MIPNISRNTFGPRPGAPVLTSSGAPNFSPARGCRSRRLRIRGRPGRAGQNPLPEEDHLGAVDVAAPRGGVCVPQWTRRPDPRGHRRLCRPVSRAQGQSPARAPRDRLSCHARRPLAHLHHVTPARVRPGDIVRAALVLTQPLRLRQPLPWTVTGAMTPVTVRNRVGRASSEAGGTGEGRVGCSSAGMPPRARER